MQPAQKDGRVVEDVRANLRNLIDAISDEKTCRKKSGSYNLIVRLLFAQLSMNWPKMRKAPVFQSLVNCVERFINTGASFWVLLALSFRKTSLAAPL